MSSGGTELDGIVRIDQVVQDKLSVDVLLHLIGQMIFVKRLQVLNELYSHAIRLQEFITQLQQPHMRSRSAGLIRKPGSNELTCHVVEVCVLYDELPTSFIRCQLQEARESFNKARLRFHTVFQIRLECQRG